MKKSILYFFVACVGFMTMMSCDDFFDTDPGNVLNEDDYIAQESEMYRGFLGIVTKMQEVGDHAIFLTDPRANYLEVTPNAPVELMEIANYAETDGNEYADPTGYYNVIVSCNDFVTKMEEFYKDVDGALSDSAKVHVPRLVSSALRLKVWAYVMLGRIYGEAYWYDTNMSSLEDIDNGQVFEYLDMKGICDKAIHLLDNGIMFCGMHIPANLEMDWTRWVDPVNGNEAYKFWNYMTPPRVVLRAELASWRANYQGSEEAARADWLWVRDSLLNYLDKAPVYAAKQGQTDYVVHYYEMTVTTILKYSDIFYSEQIGLETQTLSSIFYDYQNKQYNRIVQYFCPEYPGDGYYLKPSAYGQSLYSEADLRGPTQLLMSNTLAGQEAFTKYYYTRRENKGYLRDKIYEIEPAILLYRGHDLHFLLAEAENHLGNWEVAKAILNNGVEGTFPGGVNNLPTDSLNGAPIWSAFYQRWFPWAARYEVFGDDKDRSTGGNIGLCGVSRSNEYPLTTYADYLAANPEGSSGYLTAEEFRFSPDRIREYDMALADEYIKEFTGEGKAYSYLVKMAERYGKDWQIIYDRVAGKYEGSMKNDVATSLQGGYFIDWTLNMQ